MTQKEYAKIISYCDENLPLSLHHMHLEDLIQTMVLETLIDKGRCPDNILKEFLNEIARGVG